MAASVAIAATLVGGAAVAPASATPEEEQLYFSALKREWRNEPVSKQNLTCSAYKLAPDLLITKSVEGIREHAAARQALSKAEWTRVITKYLAWACSGPGTTPR